MIAERRFPVPSTAARRGRLRRFARFALGGLATLCGLLAAAPALPAAAADDGGLGVERLHRGDFGLETEARLISRAGPLFGLTAPLDPDAVPPAPVPRGTATAKQRLRVAAGLTAGYVTRHLAARGDQMALWPPAAPTHLLVCIEQPRSHGAAGEPDGLNSSVQRVELATGAVATVLRGLERCDGIRATPWGTVLVSEETTDGRAYEILDPLHTTSHWVADRGSGAVRTTAGGLAVSERVVQRPALPTMAWEGLAVLPDGVVVAGDELRPGEAAADRDGGAIFKFVPDVPADPAAVPVQRLEESPLVAGRVYAFAVSCAEPSLAAFPQVGQGCEVGVGGWVEVDAASARADADQRGATGRYRPEDLHADPRYTGAGARTCWSDTGRPEAAHFGEVLCLVDPTPRPALPGSRPDPRTGSSYLADGGAFATAEVQRFLAGNPRFHSFDNLAFQPRTGNLYVLEDRPFGGVWACLPDGGDRDLVSDGCLPVAAVDDPAAEATGWLFDAGGETAYLVLQHGGTPPALADFASNPLDGTTDDLIRVTGFRVPTQ